MDKKLTKLHPMSLLRLQLVGSTALLFKNRKRNPHLKTICQNLKVDFDGGQSKSLAEVELCRKDESQISQVEQDLTFLGERNQSFKNSSQ